MSLRKHNNGFCPSITATTRRCWFGVHLISVHLWASVRKMMPFVSKWSICPMNISVLQSIQQLLLISSPCQNPYLLFRICLLAEFWTDPFASFCRSPSRHSRSYRRFLQLECAFPFDLHPLQSLFAIGVNGWSTTLEDPSILGQHL